VKVLFFSSVISICAAVSFSTFATTELKPIVDSKDLVEQLVKEYQFEREFVNQTLSKAKVNQKIIKLMSKPAEGLPWYKYRNIFLKSKRIDLGVEFLNKHSEVLAEAEKKYGVPAEIITAIIGVETYYGRQKGGFNVLDALYTLGYYYPEEKANRDKRAKFFRKELVNFFNLSRQQNWDMLEIKGSYAGAMGYGQFMPSSYLAYADDFELDGKIDLFENPHDAIVSVANYFKKHGWQQGKAVALPIERDSVKNSAQESLKLTESAMTFAGVVKLPEQLDGDSKAGLFAFDASEDNLDHLLVFDNFYAITRYNHSKLYARAVWELSQEIKSKANLK